MGSVHPYFFHVTNIKVMKQLNKMAQTVPPRQSKVCNRNDIGIFTVITQSITIVTY